MRPRIALNASYLSREGGAGWSISVRAEYCEAIADAGGVPVIVPAVGGKGARNLADAMLEGIGGLVLVGGYDISAKRYGMAQSPRAVVLHSLREEHDFHLLEAALRRDLAVLGVCLGCQEINVFYGGTLFQDLPEEFPESKVVHKVPKGYAVHGVRIAPGSMLEEIMGCSSLRVNSGHHQAIRDLGSGLTATAWSSDGLIEAVEDVSRPFLLGVQWHPEAMAGNLRQSRLFRRLVSAAGDGGAKR